MIKLRILLVLFYSFSCWLPVSGQLPDGSIAPDWTLTDINGQEHHLYSYLNAGKTVYLDFTATWCDPCWIYLNQNHMGRLNELYGPEGTDEVRVIMIEGDPWTTAEDLEGLGPNTLGNWIANTNYPIIDDYSISNLYHITYWPTIYKICPNKKIEEMGMASTASLYACVGRCEGPKGINNASIFSYNDDTEMFCQVKTLKPAITIQNEGEAVLESCRIHFKSNNEIIQTIDWIGALPPLQTTDVVFEPYTIYSNTEIEFELELPNGQADEDKDYNVLQGIEFRAPQSGSTIRLAIHTDYWPEEISWTLTDDFGEVLYQHSDYPPLGVDSLYEYTFNLPNMGCHTFSVRDSFGDGLVYGPVGGGFFARGSIELESQGNKVWGNNEYGFGIDVPIDVSPFTTSAEEDILPAEAAFQLFPNPAKSYTQLTFSLASDRQLAFTITDVLGQTIQQLPPRHWPSGEHLLPIHLNRFAPGVYLIQIRGEALNQSLKFVVE